jgi:AGCS family alanine or glycine:cation symporter
MNRSRSAAALTVTATALLLPLAAAAQEVVDSDWQVAADKWFGEWLVGPLVTVLFWKIPGLDMPFVVAWLGLGAVFFTFRMGFINVRMFGHAISLVRGKYDSPNSVGEVSHFQALATALSATVGLGNIAGVAIAVSAGGPGATFWMAMFGLFGMSAKFAEVTLGQKYRHQRPDGSVMGGAMYYLSDGLAAIKVGKSGSLKPLGKVLAVMFALLCIGGSFGGGNSFQVKQSLDQVRTLIPVLDSSPWIYGLVMATLVGVVIIGGIRRIARVADKIVPVMCSLYVLACLYILLAKAGEIPAAFALIIDGAFNPDAAFGGFVGVLVMGIKRAAFSNEAGIGSAAIAHAAAKVDHPVQEGVVALLEPFIDTVIICTMTALVIVITGAYANPDPAYATAIANQQGAALTSLAMGQVVTWFPLVLAVAVVLFAYSTMISWSYYGERCWVWLFGERASMSYKVLFLIFTFLGSVITATNILEFSDLMVLGMALPNMLGLFIMSGVVARELADYRQKLGSGQIVRHD